MNYFTFTIQCLLALLIVAIRPQEIQAQEKFAEKIAKKCKDLPYEQRVRITVGSFKATTNTAYGQFAGELQTMLSNALVSTDCFQVLASTKSNIMDDMQDEKDFQQGGDVEEESAFEEGKMKGVQLVVTGEITEFAEGKEGFTVGGLGINSNKAHVGFILQLGNPQTRQIIFSESINADDIAVGGFSGLRVLGLPAIGSFKTRAMANAVEKAIIKAVELIVAQKDKIQAMPQGGNAANGGDGTKTSTLIVEDTDYSMLSSVTGKLKSNSKVINTSKSFKDGIGTLKIEHTGSVEELADFIMENVSGFSITGMEKSKITIKKSQK